MDVGDVRIEPPGHEKRIAAVYRGNGPRDAAIVDSISFDRYLLELAQQRGARIEPRLVADLQWFDGCPRLVCADGHVGNYDLLVLATGVNSNLLSTVESLGVGFVAPDRVKTFITEFHLGRECIESTLGNAMHVFLLDLPRLEFGALIPKGDFVTVCLLGREIDDDLVRTFLGAPEVRGCFPGGELPPSCCHCFPRINIGVRGPAWADRMVMVGDCGVTRLYKDGIGASYRMAKAAATTALLQGVSAGAFARHYGPACRRVDRDNTIGKLLFTCGHGAQHVRLSRRALLRMTRAEQASTSSARRMSSILWDLFTGSSAYGDILLRGFHPAFIGGLLWNLAIGGWSDPPPLIASQGRVLDA
jgi:flavin-dependent dehydrogenase